MSEASTQKAAQFVGRNDDLILEHLRARPDWLGRAVLGRLESYPEPFACWVWPGDFSSSLARVRFTVADRSLCVGVARVLWLARNGPIGPGLLLVREDLTNCPARCVNPRHRRAVNHGEALDAPDNRNAAAVNRRKISCKRGHEFTPENNYQWMADRGYRQCLECTRENYRLRKAARAKLGLSDVEYVAIHGRGRAAAENVLRNNA